MKVEKDNSKPAETRVKMIFEQRRCPECYKELIKKNGGLYCEKCQKMKATITG